MRPQLHGTGVRLVSVIADVRAAALTQAAGLDVDNARRSGSPRRWRDLEEMMDASEFGLSGVLYKAGALAPAGLYRRLDQPDVTVELPAVGVLPPSFDGRVAVYRPVPRRNGSVGRPGHAAADAAATYASRIG
jgi:hypothetical protein